MASLLTTAHEVRLIPLVNSCTLRESLREKPHLRATQESIILVCDVMSLGQYFPPFRRTLLNPSSGLSNTTTMFFLDCNMILSILVTMLWELQVFHLLRRDRLSVSQEIPHFCYKRIFKYQIKNTSILVPVLSQIKSPKARYTFTLRTIFNIIPI
jgi:hypothetical protein